MNEFLDFFSDKDWFNRPGPFGFNLERIIFLSICIFIAVYLIIKLKKDVKAAKKAIIYFWIFAVVLDLIKYGFGKVEKIYPLELQNVEINYSQGLLCCKFNENYSASLFMLTERVKG